MMLTFAKMHGLGNDFVLVDARKTAVSLTQTQVRHLADRRLGVGADQIVVLEPSPRGASVFMRIFNPDGSAAGMCGNAARCVAWFLHRKGLGSTFSIEIPGRILAAQVESARRITVDMGEPGLEWEQIPISHQVDTSSILLDIPGLPAGVACSMGNPHVVFPVADAQAVPVAQFGPWVENHPLFPVRTNVEFIQRTGPAALRMRVWERGTGITPACGSGACASVVAACRLNWVPRNEPVTVTMDGGELEITWQTSGPVLMTGPATEAFTGQIPLPT